MSKIYNLTKQIHELLPKINQKYGLEIKVSFNKGIFYDETNGVQIDNLSKMLTLTAPKWYIDKVYGLIECDQIRQILVGLQDVLGQNPEYTKYREEWQNAESNTYDCGFAIASLADTPQSQAEALCNRWLDSLTPMFDREPETVLQELIQTLQNLIK